MSNPGTDLMVFPTTGELIALDDPGQCARALYEIAELKWKIREMERRLREVMLEESIRIGSKTLHFPNGVTAKISTPAETQWDYHVLAELVQVGLPADRFEALVMAELTYKVNQSISRELSGANPVYAEIIDRAKTRVPRTPSVSVDRKAEIVDEAT